MKVKRSPLVIALEILLLIAMLAGWYGFWFSR